MQTAVNWNEAYAHWSTCQRPLYSLSRIFFTSIAFVVCFLTTWLYSANKQTRIFFLWYYKNCLVIHSWRGSIHKLCPKETPWVFPRTTSGPHPNNSPSCPQSNLALWVWLTQLTVMSSAAAAASESVSIIYKHTSISGGVHDASCSNSAPRIMLEWTTCLVISLLPSWY